jgi:hypothetical protein
MTSPVVAVAMDRPVGGRPFANGPRFAPPVVETLRARASRPADAAPRAREPLPRRRLMGGMSTQGAVRRNAAEPGKITDAAVRAVDFLALRTAEAPGVPMQLVEKPAVAGITRDLPSVLRGSLCAQ